MSRSHRSPLPPTRFLAFAAGLVCSMGSVAGTPPTIWTWSDPDPYITTNDTYIKPLIRVAAHDISNNQMSMDTLIGRIETEITNLGVGSSIAILLRNFGNAAFDSGAGQRLLFHFDDGLDVNYGTEPPTPPMYADWWRTPWATNGVAETASWFETFIERYDNAKLDPPLRFHFELEQSAWRCCCDSDALVIANLQTEMKADGRWSSEALPGFYNTSLDTLAELYANHPEEPTINGEECLNDPNAELSENQNFTQWYFPITLQAVDGALNEAVYETIRARSKEWPGCKSSNYITSARTDGQSGRVIINPTLEGSDDGVPPRWNRHAWKGAADLQAITLYPLHRSHTEGGESYWDACMRVFRSDLDSCINSFGGEHADEMSPWISRNGATWGVLNCSPGCTSCTYASSCSTSAMPCPEYTVTIDDTRRLLALLRSKDVREILVFDENTCDPTPAEGWADFDDLVTQVWKYDLSTASIVDGCANTSSLVSKLTHSDNSFIQFPGPTCGNYRYHTITGKFHPDASYAPDGMTINVETVGESGITGTIQLKNVNNSNWITLGSTFSVSTTAPGFVTRDFDPTNYIDGSGDIEFKIIHDYGTSADYSSTFNLVQLVARDEVTDQPFWAPFTSRVQILNLVLSNLNTRGGRPAGDLTGDGVVDPLDVRIALLRLIGE